MSMKSRRSLSKARPWDIDTRVCLEVLTHLYRAIPGETFCSLASLWETDPATTFPKWICEGDRENCRPAFPASRISEPDEFLVDLNGPPSMER